MWDTLTDFLGWLIAVLLLIAGSVIFVMLIRNYIYLDWSWPWEWGRKGRIVIATLTVGWFLIGLATARRGDDG